jgi:soluble lytic murein transglycosylase
MRTLASLVPAVVNTSEHNTPSQDEHVRFVSRLIHAHKAPRHEAESLAHTIVSESAKAKYDPIFVAAVIYAESMFKHGAVSHKGAQGLMQIMPETGRYVSARENISWGGARSLKDPKTNLRLGIAYLKYLDAKFGGNRERVLIAYNWGPANLNNALRRRGRAPMESIDYARKILTTHRKWKSQFTQIADRGQHRFVG